MNRTKIMIASLAMLLAAYGTNAQTANEVVELFNQAAEKVNSRDFAGAIPLLNETVEKGLQAGEGAMETVVQAQKLLPRAYFQVGGANVQSNNLQVALDNFQKAAELGGLYGDASTAANATTWIGRVYAAMAAEAFNSKDFAKAAEIFAQGYEADPTNTEMGLNLAMSYGELKNYDESFTVYKEIVALGETNGRHAEAAAKAKEGLGQYTLIKATEVVQGGDAAGGMELIQEFLTIDPANAIANMMLLQTANNAKNYDKVIEIGDAAAEAQVDPALKSDAYFLLGAAYQNKDNKAKAIENYRKVTEGGNIANARAQIAALSN